MRPIELGQCQRCRERQAEWQAVNTNIGPYGPSIVDLCDECFAGLRAIPKLTFRRAGGATKCRAKYRARIMAYMDQREPATA
jgi:hypothetical protein